MLWGIDRLASSQLSATRRRLRNADVAVLTHAAAVDRRGRHLMEVLEELGIPVRVLFTPEHGFDADAQAEEEVGSPTSERWSTRVVSLYGDSRDSLSPKPSDLEGLGALIIDLVDVGARYYTYVWSALLAARAAVEAGVHTVVLDRPNPISGDPSLLEGGPQDPAFLSFVGLEPIPIRHCVTIGELLAALFDAEGHPLGTDGALSVVRTVGWERYRSAAAWDRPFVIPSPNMPTRETALVYPGGCLVEGTNLSEGRGTTVPFQIVGAPFLDGPALATSLNESGLPGVQIRPVTFRPTFEKYAGETCHGVMLHVTDETSFRPVTTYLTLITLARQQRPDDFAFRTEPYEFEADTPAFDLLTGSNRAREAILADGSPFEVSELVAPVDATWRAWVEAAEVRLERAEE